MDKQLSDERTLKIKEYIKTFSKAEANKKKAELVVVDDEEVDTDNAEKMRVADISADWVKEYAPSAAEELIAEGMNMADGEEGDSEDEDMKDDSEKEAHNGVSVETKGFADSTKEILEEKCFGDKELALQVEAIGQKWSAYKFWMKLTELRVKGVVAGQAAETEDAKKADVSLSPTADLSNTIPGRRSYIDQVPNKPVRRAYIDNRNVDPVIAWQRKNKLLISKGV